MSTTPDIDRVQLSGPAGTDQANRPSPEKLHALAEQFESLLISQMLREMRSSVFDDGEDTGFGTNPLSDTIFTELSLALSRAGGVGFGESMIAPLLRQTGEQATAPAAIAELPGAGMPLAPASDAGGFLLPEGRVTSGYGWRRDPMSGATKFHKGTDIAMPAGNEVPAARAGQVTFAGELPGYGLTVVVNHDGRTATRYAHLSEISVKTGDVVAGGQTIALSGATGRATGPHLHFEVLEAGEAVDPQRTR